MRIQDGYTLRGETSGKGNSEGETVPVVKIEYRPATAAAMSDFRFRMAHAVSGAEQHALRVEFLTAQLLSWDVEEAGKKAAPIEARTLNMIPDPILLDMVNECAKWKPKPQAEAAGN